LAMTRDPRRDGLASDERLHHHRSLALQIRFVTSAIPSRPSLVF
jgi:hypothetical protein